jgi:DNA processing protein
VTDDRALGFAIPLAGHPGVGPRRLTELITGQGAERGWAEVGGDPSADPLGVLADHRRAGVTVLARDHVSYPKRLRNDIEPAALLFAQGDLDVLAGTLVAIVGTRRCTGAGAGFARELGRDLTAAGVGVVSGLALGIDGAAHRGVLDAGGAPVGVVGSGLDVVYPTRHRDLWHSVRTTGVLLSESPLGVRPSAWRFPARNRIIAGLAELVVVVESHAKGGAMHTVREADDRGIQVMAVPGSVRSPAAAGTNQLLAEGCPPVRDATDILVALGLSAASRASAIDARPQPDRIGGTLLAALDWEPATLEQLLVRTGLSLPELSLALETLVDTGWVSASGGWYEQAAR